MINIMTIDLEDWYQDVDIKYWSNYEDRILQNTNKLLSLLDKTNVQATFFVLGYNAERFPELIENIKDNNHEVAMHGYDHTPLFVQTPQKLEADVKKTKKILEHITKEEVIGYRAPMFSVVKETFWAIDILKKYFKYDSSIFPTKTPLYGVPEAPKYPFKFLPIDDKKTEADGLLEFPPATYEIPIIKKKIPVAGGFYLRLFPCSFLKYSIEKINEKKQPAICYLHPWEIDPQQPKIKSYKWWHYYNLDKTENKFKKVLNNFTFVSIKEYIKSEGTENMKNVGDLY